jgi:hypothetical protein
MEAFPLLARVADLMSDFGPIWALCGGWSVDAWLGRQTREHGDVDLTVFHDDQGAVCDYFTSGWLLNGHDAEDGDGTQPWDGRHLGFPSHIHAYSDDGLHLDLQLNRRSGNDWVFSRRAGVTKPISRCLRPSATGLPTLVPEAILFYKAIGRIRPHDEADFRALVPQLADPERTWLGDALSALHPNHGWLPMLRQQNVR